MVSRTGRFLPVRHIAVDIDPSGQAPPEKPKKDKGRDKNGQNRIGNIVARTGIFEGLLKNIGVLSSPLFASAAGKNFRGSEHAPPEKTVCGAYAQTVVGNDVLRQRAPSRRNTSPRSLAAYRLSLGFPKSSGSAARFLLQKRKKYGMLSLDMSARISLQEHMPRLREGGGQPGCLTAQACRTPAKCRKTHKKGCLFRQRHW